MSLTFNSKYLEYAILLFLVEVFIAMYVNDAFVRPYVGDFLVVILLYCIIRGCVDAGVKVIMVFVLLFSYLLETLQYFRIAEILGLASASMAAVVIGTSIAWFDIVAYTLGILTVLLLERKNLT